jgi:hypothetical protein
MSRLSANSTIDAKARELRKLRWHLAAARFEIAMVRHARLLRKFSVFQLRVPKGQPGAGEWTVDGSSSSAAGVILVAGGRRGGRGIVPEPSTQQTVALARANGKFTDALEKIRELEPNWKPRTESVTAPQSNEGIVTHAQARAQEAEEHLALLSRRLGIGGNNGPSLEAETPFRSASSSQPGSQSLIDSYRTFVNTSDLFGQGTWPPYKGTVAVTSLGGDAIFGVNSDAPTYTEADARAALAMRDTLVQKYPDIMATGNIGRMPNDSLFHAETTTLLRAVRANGGSLAGQSIEIDVDRSLCQSCKDVLPLLRRELGSPTLIFREPSGNRLLIK